MIFIEFVCDGPGCDEGRTDNNRGWPRPIEASETVDVYHHDWQAGTPIFMYLPEGWTEVMEVGSGYPKTFCPTCTENRLPNPVGAQLNTEIDNSHKG